VDGGSGGGPSLTRRLPEPTRSLMLHPNPARRPPGGPEVAVVALALLCLVARIVAGRVTVPLTRSFAGATRGIGAADTCIRPAPRLRRAITPAP
jgi:hypothetical protein